MNGTVLIYAVGIGVGAFLIVAILRIVFRRTLSKILMLFYMLMFAFSLPVSDVTGLMKEPEEDEK